MTRLRHTDNQEPQGSKKSPFGLMQGMRERRYERIVRQIESADKRLECLGEKRNTFAMLSQSSQGSVVNEGESNWDEAMTHAKVYHTCRKTLKSESRIAAFELFSQTMFKVALMGGASLVLLHVSMPGMTPLIAGAMGALFTLGAIMRTWGIVTTGSQEFLDAVSANLNAQKASLESERRRLIKKLHGWTDREK